MTPRRLILTLCAAEVLTMVGVFAFPALLPTFIDEWRLSNTGAGWIAGVYFAGYALAAPVLLTFTDRIDARKVWLAGAALAALASAGFAVAADGFWTALVLRLLAGVGLAATYMPGLKMLVDRYTGARQSRAIALYTSSFSLGTALSYFLAGVVDEAAGWRAAFAASALAAAVAIVLVLALRPVRPEATGSDRRPFEFGPVIRNRALMGYVLAYGIHCWELFTFRSWMVGFLAASAALAAAPPSSVIAPANIATVSGLVAMTTSIGGNELCARFGRRRTIAWVMAGSAAAALTIGFAVELPYGVVAALVLAYAGVIQLDSGALTAGAVGAADPARRGAAMAIHALIGFCVAGVGPLAFGAVLDAAGPESPATAWGLAFAAVGSLGLLGPLALRVGSRTVGVG